MSTGHPFAVCVISVGRIAQLPFWQACPEAKAREVWLSALGFGTEWLGPQSTKGDWRADEKK